MRERFDQQALQNELPQNVVYPSLNFQFIERAIDLDKLPLFYLSQLHTLSRWVEQIKRDHEKATTLPSLTLVKKARKSTERILRSLNKGELDAYATPETAHVAEYCNGLVEILDSLAERIKILRTPKSTGEAQTSVEQIIEESAPPTDELQSPSTEDEISPVAVEPTGWGEGELEGHRPSEDFTMPPCPSHDWEGWKKRLSDETAGGFETMIENLEGALATLRQKGQAAKPEDIQEAAGYLHDLHRNLATIFDEIPEAARAAADYVSDVGEFLDNLKGELNRVENLM